MHDKTYATGLLLQGVKEVCIIDFTSFSELLRGHPGLLTPFIATKLPAVRSPTSPLFAISFNLPLCRVGAHGDGQQAFQSSWLGDSLASFFLYRKKG